MIEKAHGTLRVERLKESKEYSNQGSIDRKSKAFIQMKQRQIEQIKEQFPSEARHRKIESFNPNLADSAESSAPRYINRVNKTEVSVIQKPSELKHQQTPQQVAH